MWHWPYSTFLQVSRTSSSSEKTHRTSCCAGDALTSSTHDGRGLSHATSTWDGMEMGPIFYTCVSWAFAVPDTLQFLILSLPADWMFTPTPSQAGELIPSPPRKGSSIYSSSMKNRLKQAGRNTHRGSWMLLRFSQLVAFFVCCCLLCLFVCKLPNCFLSLLHGKSRHTLLLLELPALTWFLACS